MRPPVELPPMFESAHEWVVVKPAGMPTELTTDPRGVSLIERIRRSGHPTARLPHRLDRMTRGLVVVALTAEAIAFHNEQIRAGAWAKWYLARVLADRDPSELVGSHRVYLRTIGDRAHVVRSGGKPALLDVLGHAPAPGRIGQAHVAIRLHTGRFHQIRAMLAYKEFPIAGDKKYGGETKPRDVKHDKDSRSSGGAKYGSTKRSAGGVKYGDEKRSASGGKYGSEKRSASGGDYGSEKRSVSGGNDEMRSSREAPYLEHAALRFRPYGESAARVLFNEDDPERERIDPALMQLLSRHVAATRDEERA